MMTKTRNTPCLGGTRRLEVRQIIKYDCSNECGVTIFRMYCKVHDAMRLTIMRFS